MKKLFALLCSLVLVCASAPVFPANAANTNNTTKLSSFGDNEPSAVAPPSTNEPIYTYGNLKYIKYTDYIEIYSIANETAASAVIPAEIDGLPVTSIGSAAFCSENLTSVVILNPDCTIYDSASTFCNNFGIYDNYYFSASYHNYQFSGTIYGYKNSPAQAYAEKYNRDFVALDGGAEETKNIFSGKCGENTTWTLNDEGVLTISGNGTVEFRDPAEGYYLYRIWDAKKVKQLVIEDGVTEIKDYFIGGTAGSSISRRIRGAFEDCINLDSVTIPENITDIGGRTFYHTPWQESQQNLWEEDYMTIINHVLLDGSICSDEVIIPDDVTKIADCAFRENYAITSVVIPENVTEIENNAFLRCKNLSSIKILNPECKLPNDSESICNTNGNGIGEYYGVIYGYEGSTAEDYAQKYNYLFQPLSSSAEVQTTGTIWNTINPDLTRDGSLNSKDAAMLLVFAAEFGAGNVKSFQAFMNQQYPNG